MRDARAPSADLFPTDRPLSGEDMIGREDDVDRIAVALTGGVNTVLAGPRRTGKTTVADAAMDVCAAEGLYTARVDLFETPDAAALAHQLTIALLDNRPALKRAIAEAVRAGRSVLDALRTTATYRAREDLGADVEITLEVARAEQDPERALMTAVRLAQQLATLDGRRVVVFFDEFQDIARGRFGDTDAVTRQLRAVLQRSPAVTVMFAGSLEHLMRDLFAPSDRALSQFGSFHDLEPITTGQWTAGLRTRLATDRATITDDALAALIALGDGHPRATMLLAQQAHLASIEELAHQIDNAMVVQALQRALRAERLRHEQQLERIRAAGRHAERLVRRVATGAELYAGLRPQQASRALAALRDIGVVDKGHARGEWFITDPLLRRYLANA